MALFRVILGSLRKGLEKTRDALVTGALGLKNLLTGRRLDDALIDELQARLLQADVGPATTTRLVDAIRRDFKAGKIDSGDQVLAYLKEELKRLWPPADRALRLAPSPPAVIVMTGVNGVGKTTSIAKLARLLQREGKSVMLGACDTFRAGAVAQLQTWADRLGVEVVKGQQGGDPAAVAFDACAAAKARGVDALILDTAGRLQTQDPLMRQLSKIVGVVGKQVPGGPHEVLLVLDATSGQNALRQAEEFSKAAGVSGIFLSKLDGTAKGGIVVAIREATSIPVKFIGTGETPDDVEPFDPAAFVDAIFAE
ncbi:MAG: signal recognition particle-docking protein FtsY [Phycisphaerae bacterium]|nr:MAG: signal recognition particle-docking protein FtsY [Phycisphaerae bacterium]